jgi:hypothetical protein
MHAHSQGKKRAVLAALVTSSGREAPIASYFTDPGGRV